MATVILWLCGGISSGVAQADTSPPSVPAGLAASGTTINSFTLTWTASTDNIGVTGYEVYKGSVSLGTTAALTLNVTGLAPNTTYSMKVRARDAAGKWSAFSPVLAVKTLADTTPPVVPAGLAASAMTATGFTVTWAASTDNVAVTGYEVFKNGATLGTTSALVLSKTVTGLAPTTAYAITVRARDAVGNWSAQSPALSVSTLPDTTAPTVPAGLAAATVTATGFTFKWTAATDNVRVTGYEIFRDGTSLGVTTATSKTLTPLSAAVTGSADLTYEWVGVPVSFSNSTSVRTTSPVFTLVFSSDGVGPRNTIKLVARNPSGEATSAPIVFTVLPDPPVVTSQPTRVSAQSGRDLSIGIQRNSTAGSFLEYEWRRNGQILATPPGGSLGPPLVIPKVTAADAGTYTITLRNALGVAGTSTPIVVTIDDSSRLANLSTRAFVGPGEQTLIAGFSISGEQTRRVLIRAVGPALAKFGVTDALTNPQIRLIKVGSNTESLAFSSNGWDANSTDGNTFLRGEFAKVGAFAFDAGSKDNAGVAQLAPGNYTVQVTDKTGQGGTALVELYEDDNDAARMLNVSSRAMVTPASPAICGLSIQGSVAKRVLLRGVGPGLSAFGISGVLSDPCLTLKDASGVTVASNDNWETSTNLNDLRAAMPAVGAFALPGSSKDAALLVTLSPGNYTMIIEGAPGQSGVALVEAYEVP